MIIIELTSTGSVALYAPNSALLMAKSHNACVRYMLYIALVNVHGQLHSHANFYPQDDLRCCCTNSELCTLQLPEVHMLIRLHGLYSTYYQGRRNWPGRSGQNRTTF